MVSSEPRVAPVLSRGPSAARDLSLEPAPDPPAHCCCAGRGDARPSTRQVDLVAANGGSDSAILAFGDQDSFLQSHPVQAVVLTSIPADHREATVFSTFWWLIVWILFGPFAYVRLRTWRHEAKARDREGVRTCEEDSHHSSRRAFRPEDLGHVVAPQGDR